MTQGGQSSCLVIIIGGGPAGMTAAIYSARQAMCTLVIAPDLGGQGAQAWCVENYTGYQQISGLELMRKFEEHMHQFDVSYEPDSVVRVRPVDDDYIVQTAGGKEIKGSAIIVASGRVPRPLDVPGVARLEGRGVAYCATCDAPLFRGEDVAVIGGGNSAIQAALQLSDLARRVVLVSNFPLTGERVMMERLAAAPNVERKDCFDTIEIKGEESVSGIAIRHIGNHQITEIPVKGVFIEVGSMPNSGFIKDLVETDQTGQIVVDKMGQTSRLGIFAAGDVTDTPEKQIVISAGEGARAALSAYRYLLGRSVTW